MSELRRDHVKSAANANANLSLADGCIGLLERMEESANPRRVRNIERQLRALIQDELTAYDKAREGVTRGR